MGSWQTKLDDPTEARMEAAARSLLEQDPSRFGKRGTVSSGHKKSEVLRAVVEAGLEALEQKEEAARASSDEPLPDRPRLRGDTRSTWLWAWNRGLPVQCHAIRAFETREITERQLLVIARAGYLGVEAAYDAIRFLATGATPLEPEDSENTWYPERDLSVPTNK